MRTSIVIALGAAIVAASPQIIAAQAPSAAPIPSAAPGVVTPVPPANTTAPNVMSTNPAGQLPATSLTPPTAPLTPVEPLSRPPVASGLAPATAPVGSIPGIAGQTPVGRPTTTTFSETQIRANLAAQGYDSVTGLTVDGTGTWHGTAVKDGANIPVTVNSDGIVSSY